MRRGSSHELMFPKYTQHTQINCWMSLRCGDSVWNQRGFCRAGERGGRRTLTPIRHTATNIAAAQ